MLEKIEQLIKIDTTTGKFENINYSFELLKILYPNLFYKEIIQNNYKSILFSNFNNFSNFDVLAIGHLDTVAAKEELFNLKIIDNKAFARGVFDMKSFIISSLENLSKIKNIKIGVLITSDEETDSKNGTQFWYEKLNLRSRIILDSDNGYNLNNMIQEINGAATIKLISDDIFAKFEVIEKMKKIFNIKEVTNKFEIDFYFKNREFNKIDILTKKYNMKYSILLFYDNLKYNINNKFFQKYKNILEKNIKRSVDIISSDNITDSRFFYDTSFIIVNQATGGDNHKDSEWLDLDSLYLFCKIQLDFLTAL